MNDIVNQPVLYREDKLENKIDNPPSNNANYIPLRFEQVTDEIFQEFTCLSSGYKPELQDTIAVCLTAYNEELNAYKDSLSGLAKAGQYFKSMELAEISSNFLICILVDGMDAMDENFARYAASMGIYDPLQLDKDAAFHLFESSIPRYLLDKDTYGESNSVYEEGNDKQKVLLLIKNKNYGKLHSHKCFFDIACKLYSPDFFLQIDVGTIPEADALYHMWQHLHDNPDIAATAARSHLPSPGNPLNLLQQWQFCDIALERIINWPTEILMGNLSVLPGQLSLTRMRSVLAQNSIDQQSPGVLDNYYKGLSSLSPLESNMYLAEDRILGLEMVFQNKNQWELNYATKAEATVDACQSWSELLKQRRRWICSSIACRISMLKRLPLIFDNSERNRFQQMHKVVAAIYSIIFSLFCWFVPTFYLVVQSCLYINVVKQLTSPLTISALSALWIFSLVFFITQIYLAWNRNVSARSERLITVGIYIQAANICICSILCIYFFRQIPGSDLLTAAFLAMLTGYSLLGIFYSKKLFLNLSKNLLTYSLSRPVISSFLMIYSIINCHDTSWGTKGLDTTQANTSKTYQSFRNKVILLFASTNLLAFAALTYAGLLDSVWPVTIIISFTLVQIFIALMAFFINRLQTKNLGLDKENLVFEKSINNQSHQ
jgi:chitin synthase